MVCHTNFSTQRTYRQSFGIRNFDKVNYTFLHDRIQHLKIITLWQIHFFPSQYLGIEKRDSCNFTKYNKWSYDLKKVSRKRMELVCLIIINSINPIENNICLKRKFRTKKRLKMGGFNG